MGNKASLRPRPSWARQCIAAALGEAAVQLIETIANHAHAEGLAIYLVGGVVRDLALGRTNLDLDFVLEGDAIAFSAKLARRYGGDSEKHIPFGTAKWQLDSAAIDKLGLGSGQIPAQIDFATARTENYLAPATLPTVKPGTILEDLRRRDFTVNALALDTSIQKDEPNEEQDKERDKDERRPWQLLDVTDGYSDILGKRIRILHAGSFIDDPTRIFRACRFASRFDFAIEAVTAQRMREAIPLIQRLSGERVRHELDLILREEYPERIILELRALGIFTRIHDTFRVCKRLDKPFERLREYKRKHGAQVDEVACIGWHLLFLCLSSMTSQSSEQEANALMVCARLNLRQDLSKSILGYTRLLAKLDWIGARASKNSAITRFLDGIPENAMQAALICNVEQGIAIQRLECYLSDWRHRRSAIDGKDLLRAGLQPGPVFRDILHKLRSAWIDGEVETPAQERELFLKLVQEAKELGGAALNVDER